MEETTVILDQQKLVLAKQFHVFFETLDYYKKKSCCWVGFGNYVPPDLLRTAILSDNST